MQLLILKSYSFFIPPAIKLEDNNTRSNEPEFSSFT